MTDKVIRGIYIVEKKYEKIRLTNKIEEKQTYMDYFKFHNLLFQSFNEDYIKKILNALNSEKKLLIDFDKDIVKQIVDKEPKFEDNFSKYFSAAAAQGWLDTEIDFENKLYGIDKGDYFI